MVAKPKRSLIQRWFDEVFSDTVAELGRQTVAPKTFLLSETHRNDKRSHTCMLLGCEIYNHLMEDILTP